MNEQSTPIKKKAAKVLFEMIFQNLEIADIELTDHFLCRQRERNVDLIDVNDVLKNGSLKKEYRPDRDHPAWRWSYCKGKTTIVFTVNFELKHVVFITCWNGDEPKEGER